MPCNDHGLTSADRMGKAWMRAYVLFNRMVEGIEVINARLALNEWPTK